MSKDYTSTLNLPKTEFSMRANLPQREPETLKYWADKQLYSAMLKNGKESPRSCFTTDLLSLTALSIWDTLSIRS